MLVDTLVWVEHLRTGNAALASVLESAEVWSHPFVQGELACGNLRNREEILSLIGSLPQGPVISHEEALSMLERQGLMGSGLGWVDIHLLGSALLAGVPLWTLDRRLSEAAERMGIRVP